MESRRVPNRQVDKPASRELNKQKEANTLTALLEYISINRERLQAA